jgi:alpha-ketoglutaric semialdehyde dehydrogenase
VIEAHGNTIGGERVPARSGRTFEVLASRRREDEVPRSLGTFPRSDASDVDAALAAARAAQDAWLALGERGRLEILGRAARELAADPDPGGVLAERLALDPGELSPHFEGLEEALDRALSSPAARFTDRRIEDRGLLLLAPAWCEFLAAPASSLFAALLLGRTVLCVSDPVAPMMADTLGGALLRAGLPPGVLSVLHVDGDDVLRAVGGTGTASFALLSGYPQRVRRLERAVRRPSGGASDGTAIELRVLRLRSSVVGAGEDLPRRAAEIAQGAFGRSRTLSGQLPGQIGRAIVDQRALSRFTEELLSVLRKSEDLARPVPFVDSETEQEFRRACVLGLDEGAALIFDGAPSEPAGADNEGDAAGASPGAGPGASSLGSPAAPDDAILGPSVFTNVEERMRLASLQRPTSLLCLFRVGSGVEAAALAERLDGRDPGPPPDA